MRIAAVIVLAHLYVVGSTPILKQVAEFIHGIRLVPQVGGIFSPTYNPPAPDGLGTEERQESEDQEDNGVVFKENGGWLTSGDTKHSYLLGDKDMSWSEAREWCASHDGYLAELRNSKENYALGSLLADRKEGLANFWIGLKRPFNRWVETRRLVTWGNWVAQDGDSSKRCAVINGDSFKWEVQDCSYNHGFRALCQKLPEIIEAKEVVVEKNTDKEVDNLVSEHCIVKGVSTDLTNWLERREYINSSAGCHNICVRTYRCNFWTWDSQQKRCFLKENDSPVVRADHSESGTTLRSKGCHTEIKRNRESRVETCSCVKARKPEVFSPGYLDPRSSFQAGSELYSEGAEGVGRLIQNTACPYGQTLVCTDDDEDNLILESKSPVLQANITDCLVYDVRLSVGNSLFTLYDVANPETCHAHCMATTGCAYWTWRGDLKNKACFLKNTEGRMLRRQGAASGTVQEKYGCRYRLVVEAELRTEDTESCACEPEEEDWASLIDPRSIHGSGRIVNDPPTGSYTNTKTNVCPSGYKVVCRTQVPEKPHYPQEWTHSIQPNIPLESLYGRQASTDADPSSRSPRVLEASTKSFVNFPE